MLEKREREGRKWRGGNKEKKRKGKGGRGEMWGKGGKAGNQESSLYTIIFCVRGMRKKRAYISYSYRQTDGYTTKELRSNSVEIDGKARSIKAFWFTFLLLWFFFFFFEPYEQFTKAKNFKTTIRFKTKTHSNRTLT